MKAAIGLLVKMILKVILILWGWPGIIILAVIGVVWGLSALRKND